MNNYYQKKYFSNANKGHCNGIELDGVDDAITIPDAASIQNMFDGGGSASFWINPHIDGENNFGTVFAKLKYFMHTTSESSGAVKIEFGLSFDSQDGLWITTSRDITLNVLSHVCITYNSSASSNNPIFYINNISKTVGSGITETTAPDGTRESDASNDLWIGNKASHIYAFDGIIDNLKLWDTILTPTQVAQEYTAKRKDTNLVAGANLQGWWKLNDTTSTIVDSSTNSNDGEATDGGVAAAPTNSAGRYRKCR